MRRSHLVVALVAALAIAAAGGAFAADKLMSPTARSQAIIGDAAGRLGIDPSKLTTALQKAIDDQIDAAVKAGTLTQAQADALKQRVDSGQVPLIGGLGLGPGGRFRLGVGPGRGFRRQAAAIASYLGITTDELRSELASGKTLAQIATAHGKTADDIVDKLYAAAKTRLDQAVAKGRLNSQQEQRILAGLKTMLTRLVNGTLPPRFGGHGSPFRLGPFRPGFGFGFRGHSFAPPARQTQPARATL